MESRTHVWKVADRRQLAGAADHVRRKGRQPGAVLSRRQVHQLRVGARRRGSQGADLRDVHRRRRGVEADRRQGERHRRIRGRPTDRASRLWRPIRAAPRKKPTSRSATTSACSKATSGSRTRGSSTCSTKEATRITEGTQWTVQGAPSWSPDGKQFVFGAATTPMLRDNRRDVYRRRRLAPTGQRRRSKRSAPTGATTASPRWSQDGATIAWVSEPNTTTPLPDGTAAGVVMQQRLMLYDVKAKTIKDTLTPAFDSEAGNPDLDQRRQARDVRHRQARLQRGVRLRPDLGHLHAALAEAHDQRHVDQQGRPDDRADDGCAGFGDGDLRHRSVVRQLQAADEHQPAARGGRSRARPK